MTYEERKASICEGCGRREGCGYIGRGLTDKCPEVDGVMTGWEYGVQDAVDKTVDWFYSQLNGGTMDCGNILAFIENYRKTMKEY